MLQSKNLVLLATVVICFSSTKSLPVKETSTQKAPNEHNQEEQPQANLENIIGKDI